MSQRYPTPDIQLFLARIEDSLRPIFSPAQLKKYQATVNAVFLESPPLDIVGKAFQKIEMDHPGSDNWHSSFFANVYGGIRSPVASSNRLSLRLKPPMPPASADPQAYSAARYLRAIGIWAIHLRDGETFTPLQKVLKQQMDSYLYTFRNPGLEMDKLYTLPVPEDVNAAVFCHGVPHLVQIARSRVVLSVEAIYAQLTAIKAQEIVSIKINFSGPRNSINFWLSPPISSPLLRTPGGWEGPSGTTFINNYSESMKITHRSDS